MRDRRVLKKKSHAFSSLVGHSQPKCCDHFGIVFDSFGIHFGITLDIFGSLWDKFGIIVESFVEHVGIVLG